MRRRTASPPMRRCPRTRRSRMRARKPATRSATPTTAWRRNAATRLRASARSCASGTRRRASASDRAPLAPGLALALQDQVRFAKALGVEVGEVRAQHVPVARLHAVEIPGGDDFAVFLRQPHQLLADDVLDLHLARAREASERGHLRAR